LDNTGTREAELRTRRHSLATRSTIARQDSNRRAAIAKYHRTRSTLRVGSFAANPWGLFNMLGNLCEWTADSYAAYPGATGPVTPPFPPGRKVIRAASWLFGAHSASIQRVDVLHGWPPDHRGA
jgi:formylglycine-generating enzyme required for sulfatase activity